MTESETSTHGAQGLGPLFSELYDELRALAARRMGRAAQTLQPTALVHEAYVKLSRAHPLRFNDLEHFRATAARVIRQVLVNHAAAAKTLKRGGDRLRVTVDEALLAAETNDVDLVALDAALSKLADVDERQARVVELRFFGGLSMLEVAEQLGVSERTIQADWAVARAWLAWQMREEEGA